jgi:hypothetical protein
MSPDPSLTYTPNVLIQPIIVSNQSSEHHAALQVRSSPGRRRYRCRRAARSHRSTLCRGQSDTAGGLQSRGFSCDSCQSGIECQRLLLIIA